MRALWLENNQIELRDVPQPCKPNEALIKIRKAGICSTDLELVKGYYPYTGILGHEFVGEVLALSDSFTPGGALPETKLGEKPELTLGDRVVGEINAVCNVCEQCSNGRSSHC